MGEIETDHAAVDMEILGSHQRWQLAINGRQQRASGSATVNPRCEYGRPPQRLIY